MAQKKYDLAVKVGVGADGKAIWKNIGACLEGDKGPYLVIDRTFSPAGVPSDRSSILVSMFAPKAKGDEDYSQSPF